MQSVALIHPHAALLATDAAVTATAPIQATHAVPSERAPVAGTVVGMTGTVPPWGVSAVKKVTTVMLGTSARSGMGIKCVVLRLDVLDQMGRVAWGIRSILDLVLLRQRRHLCLLPLLRRRLILMCQLRLQVIRIRMTAMSMNTIILRTTGE